MKLRSFTATVLCLSFLALAGCDTAEERAERHFLQGMEYLNAGDVDRALVEFRNVFKLNGEHREARLAYASAERARGNVRESFSQYLRLIEQIPDDPEGLRALGELSAEAGQWEDAARYLDLALRGAPEDVGLTATRTFVRYGDAIQRNDSATIVAAVESARKLQAGAPDNLWLHKIIVDDLIRSQRLTEALSELDKAIDSAPREKLLYAQKLSVNAALGDEPAVEAGLIEMVTLFPEASEMPEALSRWYISRKEFDKAEAFLRSRIDPSSEDDRPRVELVSFLGQYRGPDAALKELDAIIASGRSVSVFRSARAGFRFDRGDREGAIAEMEEVLASTTDGEDARTVRLGLARMKLAIGDNEAARALVDQVLDEDSGNVEAVKLKSTWLILDDQAGEAVALIRDAIDQNPLDPSLLTLMAQAYERNGERELMRDMLSRAVDVSGRAPAESGRYAQLLASENKLLPAEGVLIEALRIAPGDPSLLVLLGQVYVALKDWPRAEDVARDLEGLGDDSLLDEVAAIRSAAINAQQNAAGALSSLEQLAAQQGAGLGAKLAVLRNHLANRRNPEALAYAAALVAEDPENPDLLLVEASVKATVGDLKGAEEGYRAVTGLDPARTDAWLALFAALSADPTRKTEAHGIIEEALAANPTSAELRWAKAGILEGAGDIEGAIAIYEDLYEENSANPIVANNLASLLSNYRTDKESLRRAEVVARRLRGSNIAPYQDTTGWIAYLNGDYNAALEELEKAAKGLPDDPSVRYHLAMTYLALGRSAEAARELAESVRLLPEGDSRAFAISAKSELDKLKAAGIVPELP